MSPDPLLFVRAGRLVDPIAGEILVDRTIVVRGDRVEAVLAPGAVPAGAR